MPNSSQRELEEKLSIANEQIEALKKEIGIYSPCPAIFKLSPTETAFLGLLMRRDLVSENMIFAALYSGRDADLVPGSKVVDVFMHLLRKKLAPFGIAINTIRGVGRSLSPADKAKVRSFLEEETCTYAENGPRVDWKA
jgi:DNA-binding response OmpR family regulator